MLYFTRPNIYQAPTSAMPGTILTPACTAKMPPFIELIFQWERDQKLNKKYVSEETIAREKKLSWLRKKGQPNEMGGTTLVAFACVQDQEGHPPPHKVVPEQNSAVSGRVSQPAICRYARQRAGEGQGPELSLTQSRNSQEA